MTHEDFLVDGAIFQSTQERENRWYKYQLQVSQGTSKLVVVVYRLFPHNLKRVNDEGVHVDFVRGGVKFWSVLGSIYTYSRIYKYDEFELITTPSEKEPSVQGALSLANEQAQTSVTSTDRS
jgi:hypothetical protein